MASNLALLWFTAYENVYDLMELRGYTPVIPKLQFAEFFKLYSEWTSSGHSEPRWFHFEHPSEPDTHVTIITASIGASAESFDPTNITRYIEYHKNDLKSKFKTTRDEAVKAGRPAPIATRKQLVINAIVVVDKVTAPALQELNQLGPRLDRRADMTTNSPPVLEVFNYSNLQINPIKFCMQPTEIELITDEARKEEIRLQLVRVSDDKTKTLEDLLPLARFGRPLALWYGAKVGDVFRFRREIGGLQPYMRIVMPEPPNLDDKKSKKKIEYEDELDF